MDFWDEIFEEEQKQEEQTTLPEIKEVKQDKPEETTKKSSTNKKTPAKKNENKTVKETKKSNTVKETKVLTLEEQLAQNTNPNIKRIAEHLQARGDMQEKMQNPTKSLQKMWEHIMSCAKRQATNGCAMIEDAEVHGWAVHYYDEDNI